MLRLELIRDIGPRLVSLYIRALCHVYSQSIRRNLEYRATVLQNKPVNLAVDSLPEDDWKRIFLSHHRSGEYIRHKEFLYLHLLETFEQ